jgi:hypothetical protein
MQLDTWRITRALGVLHASLIHFIQFKGYSTRGTKFTCKPMKSCLCSEQFWLNMKMAVFWVVASCNMLDQITEKTYTTQ